MLLSRRNCAYRQSTIVGEVRKSIRELVDILYVYANFFFEAELLGSFEDSKVAV